MKNTLQKTCFALIFSALLIQCTSKKEETPTEGNTPTEEMETAKEKNTLSSDKKEKLRPFPKEFQSQNNQFEVFDWVLYYKGKEVFLGEEIAYYETIFGKNYNNKNNYYYKDLPIILSKSIVDGKTVVNSISIVFSTDSDADTINKENSNILPVLGKEDQVYFNSYGFTKANSLFDINTFLEGRNANTFQTVDPKVHVLERTTDTKVNEVSIILNKNHKLMKMKIYESNK